MYGDRKEKKREGKSLAWARLWDDHHVSHGVCAPLAHVALGVGGRRWMMMVER